MRHERIVLTRSGFEIRDGRRLLGRLTWLKVKRIIAYKRDELTTDLICLDVEAGEPNETWLLHEEMDGFDQLTEVLARRLPGTLSEWRAAVVRQPFAVNRTIIYERA